MKKTKFYTPINCEFCGCSLREHRLSAHLKKAHKEEWEKIEQSQNEIISCEICNESLARKDLRKHQNSKHKFGQIYGHRKSFTPSNVEKLCICCGKSKFGTIAFKTGTKTIKNVCKSCKKIIFQHSKKDTRDALELSNFVPFESNRRRH